MEKINQTDLQKNFLGAQIFKHKHTEKGDSGGDVKRYKWWNGDNNEQYSL